MTMLDPSANRHFFTGYLFGGHLLLVEQLDRKQSIVRVVVVFVTVLNYGALVSFVVVCVVHLYRYQSCVYNVQVEGLAYILTIWRSARTQMGTNFAASEKCLEDKRREEHAQRRDESRQVHLRAIWEALGRCVSLFLLFSFSK